MAVVTATDRSMSVRNHCVIEVFGCVFVLSLCFREFSVGIGAFVIGLSQISSFISILWKSILKNEAIRHLNTTKELIWLCGLRSLAERSLIICTFFILSVALMSNSKENKRQSFLWCFEYLSWFLWTTTTKLFSKDLHYNSRSTHASCVISFFLTSRFEIVFEAHFAS